tara:strand:- start:13 stop:213 length:201 start_codon:yes stop_codon:yes gene_type:complete
MTHRIVVNCETGVTTIVQYTPEEQAVHDAAVAAQAEAQALADAQALAEAQALVESQATQQQTNEPT